MDPGVGAKVEVEVGQGFPGIPQPSMSDVVPMDVVTPGTGAGGGLWVFPVARVGALEDVGVGAGGVASSRQPASANKPAAIRARSFTVTTPDISSRGQRWSA